MEAPGAGADGEGHHLGNGHDGDRRYGGQDEDSRRHHRPRDAPVCLAEEHPGQGLGHAAEGADRRDREGRQAESHPHGQRERVHIQALPARPPDPGDTPPPDAGPLPLGEREDREVLRDVQGIRGPRRLPSAEDPGGARRVPLLVRRGQAPPPSRREDPGRGLGRDGPLREASNRSKGSLPLGRAAEGVPVQLQIKYCTPTGMLYAVRFCSVSGSANTAFFSQYRHPRCRSGVPFLKKDSGRGTPPPSRREDPGRGLGRDGPLREASNRSTGSLPLGRAAEGVPVQLQIKYCTPTGMLYAVRFFSVSGSAKTAFFSQYRHPRCRSGVPFLKKDSGRGNGATMIAHKVLPPGRRAAGYSFARLRGSPCSRTPFGSLLVGAAHWRMRATLCMPHAGYGKGDNLFIRQNNPFGQELLCILKKDIYSLLYETVSELAHVERQHKENQ